RGSFDKLDASAIAIGPDYARAAHADAVGDEGDDLALRDRLLQRQLGAAVGQIEYDAVDAHTVAEFEMRLPHTAASLVPAFLGTALLRGSPLCEARLRHDLLQSKVRAELVSAELRFT